MTNHPHAAHEIGNANRRKADRVQIPGIKIQVQSAKGEPKLLCRCVHSDISGGGLKITSSRPLSKKSLVHIIIKFPSSQDVFKIESEVVWCRPVFISGKKIRKYSMGIRFIKIRDEDQERFLFNFVDYLVVLNG